MQIGISIDKDGNKYVVVSLIDPDSKGYLTNLISPALARFYAELLVKSAETIDKSSGD